ncbi:hypothetical protein Tchl_1723 [Thauera chlorobenzoica]|uniref:Uncharacterized protein n=1 Tax=Thauera chlorobenzoica TaxID=96773 RepID=A0A1L6FCD6_9RHOO|nr:hypothetical protein Tchl_1723 [Thauera chlorobenzoica]
MNCKTLRGTMRNSISWRLPRQVTRSIAHRLCQRVVRVHCATEFGNAETQEYQGNQHDCEFDCSNAAHGLAHFAPLSLDQCWHCGPLCSRVPGQAIRHAGATRHVRQPEIFHVDGIVRPRNRVQHQHAGPSLNINHLAACPILTGDDRHSHQSAIGPLCRVGGRRYAFIAISQFKATERVPLVWRVVRSFGFEIIIGIRFGVPALCRGGIVFIGISVAGPVRWGGILTASTFIQTKACIPAFFKTLDLTALPNLRIGRQIALPLSLKQVGEFGSTTSRRRKINPVETTGLPLSGLVYTIFIPLADHVAISIFILCGAFAAQAHGDGTVGLRRAQRSGRQSSNCLLPKTENLHEPGTDFVLGDRAPNVLGITARTTRRQPWPRKSRRKFHDDIARRDRIALKIDAVFAANQLPGIFGMTEGIRRNRRPRQLECRRQSAGVCGVLQLGLVHIQAPAIQRQSGESDQHDHRQPGDDGHRTALFIGP